MSERQRITEDEWMDALLELPVLHQWGSAFLVDQGGVVVAYVRDESGQGRHARVRLDEAASARARHGVAAIEAASARAADLIGSLRDGGTLDQMRAQEAASTEFVQLAESVYRELLSG